MPRHQPDIIIECGEYTYRLRCGSQAGQEVMYGLPALITLPRNGQTYAAFLREDKSGKRTSMVPGGWLFEIEPSGGVEFRSWDGDLDQESDEEEEDWDEEETETDDDDETGDGDEEGEDETADDDSPGGGDDEDGEEDSDDDDDSAAGVDGEDEEDDDRG